MPLNLRAVPLTLEYKDAFLAALEQMTTHQAERIVQALERLAQTGHSDTEILGDDHVAVFRLRVGGWRVFFDLVTETRTLVVQDVEKRGQAYSKKSRRKSKRS
jgi:mRNA-degrading endonuclease RelE of RelBE toxin-antitoxin system